MLGLGGWLLGTLIVLTTMPGVSFDNQLVAVVAAGVPVGLGARFAWVNRAWSAKAKITGFAAAMIGALIGASLWFNATSSLLSIVTAIVGAAVGAILILLILDMTGDRSNRKRFPAVGVLAAPMATAGHARPATVDKPSARTLE